MAVRGAKEVIARLVTEEARIEAATAAAAEEIAAALHGWALVHPWKNRRPHTESTIAADVEVLRAYVKVTLSASYDAGLWLELFHGGQWSWLWPVLVEHQGEILGILIEHLSPWGFRVTGPVAAVRNPDVASEAETARALMDEARAHTPR